jgi:hypothetical protein
MHSRYAVDVFRKGLAETGFVEDRNVTVEYHWLEGQFERLPGLLPDIVRRRVQSSPCSTTPSLRPRRKARQRRSRSSCQLARLRAAPALVVRDNRRCAQYFLGAPLTVCPPDSQPSHLWGIVMRAPYAPVASVAPFSVALAAPFRLEAPTECLAMPASYCDRRESFRMIGSPK